MSVSREYLDWLQDLLRPLGHIRLRRMFGGYGIYADELFFAVVLDEQLFIKVDAQTRAVFEAAGLEEWVYEKDGKPVHMNYFRPPEDIYDDEESLQHWGRLALAAALRTRKPVQKTVHKKVSVKKVVEKKSLDKKSASLRKNTGKKA